MSGTMPDETVVRRSGRGWIVGDEQAPDLTSAMVLADLLAADLAGKTGEPSESTAARKPSPRHARPLGEAAEQSEAARLAVTVQQLEHALTARVRVEQAIGVLAERHRIKPRQAFEQLRTAARNRGRKVIDIASDVVASASNPLLQLPEELSRPRASSRRVTRQPNSA